MERSAHFKVGEFDCWAVSDLAQPEIMHIDGWALAAEPGALHAWLEAHGEHPEAITLDYLCLLAHLGGKWLLADAGSGPKAAPGVSRLREHLAQLGVSPEDIDVVMISHSHYDHIGGTLLADDSPAFSRARVVLYEGEREQLNLRAPVRQVLFEAAQEMLPKLAGQLEYLPDGAEVLPGARLVACPGHTTGHSALMIRSQGERLLYTGDLFYHALQVEHPEWCSQFDLRPAQAQASRERIYRWAAEEGFRVLPAHTLLPAAGKIMRSVEGFRWAPES
ncbi:MAG: MBL fold metallo-hydrolase [Anaerolineae bacterium]